MQTGRRGGMVRAWCRKGSRIPRRLAQTILHSFIIAGCLLLHPVDAMAQSNGLGWLKEIERWTHEEDYRTWIAHGLVTTASTLFGHWAFDKAHYGAGAAVMFYIGVEYQELRRDDWVVHKKLDKFMDLAVPITVGTALVILFSEDDASEQPPFLPVVEGEKPVGRTGASTIAFTGGFTGGFTGAEAIRNAEAITGAITGAFLRSGMGATALLPLKPEIGAIRPLLPFRRNPSMEVVHAVSPRPDL